MRLKKWLTALCLLMVLLVSQSQVAMALDCGFETTPVQDPSVTAGLQFRPITDEPKKKPIERFDVREDGAIAIGTAIASDKTICVYRDSAFQYGLTFSCDGDFGLEWVGEHIAVYFTRSDLAIEVDQYGNIISAFEIADTSENNSYWHDEVFANTRTIGNTKYTLRNDMGLLNMVATSYAQLVATAADGSETLLYDVNGEMLATTIMWCAIAAVGVGVVIYGLRREFVKLKKNKKSDSV